MPAAGVPEMVAVPLPLSVKVTPVGREPVSVRAGEGAPVVVTVVEKAAPTLEAAELALVMAGATFSVRVVVPVPATLVHPDSSPP